MKSLELSEIHKSKLLEMCTELFPEMNFEFEYDIYGRVLKQNMGGVLAVWYKDKDAYKQGKYAFNMHWFEFVFTKLSSEFYPKYDTHINGTGADYEVDMFQECIVYEKQHPIDYIYSQFLKLK